MGNKKIKRNIADFSRIFVTCLSTLFCSVVLLGIISYVTIKGTSGLSWKLFTSDYEEQMVTLRVEDEAGLFTNPNRKDEFFSYSYGIGLKDSKTTDGEKSVIITYIDDNSPFKKAFDKSDEQFSIQLGSRLSVFTGITEEDEIIFTKVSDNAEIFASKMDQTVIVSSIQCKVGGGGIRGSLLSTLLLIVVTLIIALPLGIGASVYLVEYAKENKFKHIIQSMIDMTSGIPSIIFGFCGSLIFIPFVDNAFGSSGYSILAGAMTLALMLLPIIIKTTSESLMLIPGSMRMASLALGASKTQTVAKVIIPNAVPGILTATLLSIGRIIGESAALIFVMGTAISDNVELLKPATSLSLHIWSIVGGENPNYSTACSLSIIILIVVLTLSVVIKIISKKMNKMGV